MPLPDVRIFVSCIQIQRESGGNLGEILDSMSLIVRERFKLRKQVRIYTAEGRLSMYMLSLHLCRLSRAPLGVPDVVGDLIASSTR